MSLNCQHPTPNSQHRRGERGVVGLGRVELPTSPLSGVRSSHLSYRPTRSTNWWSWSGSNRRPPECKSGALPAELQPPEQWWLVAGGWWPASHQPSATGHWFLIEADWMHGLSGRAGKPLGFIRGLQARDAGTGSPESPKGRRRLEWNGCLLLQLPALSYQRSAPKQQILKLTADS